MKTRNGKIARLPRNVRDELNRRLENGETEGVILPWLNALMAVQTVLGAQFGGRPVSQQNLTNWRRDGYRHWLKEQEHHHLVRETVQDAKELAGGLGSPELANHISTVLVAELAVSVRDVQMEAATPEARYNRLRELLHTVSKVRRDDCRTGRLVLDRLRKEAS